LSKPLLTGPDGAAKDETRATAAWALDEILKLLHPFMPFVTEELWRVTGASVSPGRAEGASPASRDMHSDAALDSGPGASRRPGRTERDSLLVLTPWPRLEGLDAPDAEAEIGWVVDLVTAIRAVRAEMTVTATMPLVLAGASPETRARAERWAEFINRLARVSDITFAEAPPQGSVQLLVRGEVAALPLKGVIDLDAELARLQKEMHKVEADIKRVDAKLGNAQFLERAPEEVVEEEREKRTEAEGRRQKIVEALERLKGAA
jgi:valyl-tRNA synthetase